MPVYDRRYRARIYGTVRANICTVQRPERTYIERTCVMWREMEGWRP